MMPHLGHTELMLVVVAMVVDKLRPRWGLIRQDLRTREDGWEGKDCIIASKCVWYFVQCEVERKKIVVVAITVLVRR